MEKEPRIRTPDIMDIKKYRGRYSGHNLHMAIGSIDGLIREVQITVCDNDPMTQPLTYAMVDMIEGLINALLQHENPYSTDYIIEVIGKKSRRKDDLPGRIIEMFNKHLEGGVICISH